MRIRKTAFASVGFVFVWMIRLWLIMWMTIYFQLSPPLFLFIKPFYPMFHLGIYSGHKWEFASKCYISLLVRSKSFPTIRAKYSISSLIEMKPLKISRNDMSHSISLMKSVRWKKRTGTKNKINPCIKNEIRRHSTKCHLMATKFHFLTSNINRFFVRSRVWLHFFNSITQK